LPGQKYWAGIPGGLVTYGDDNIRRQIFVDINGLTGESFAGKAKLFQRLQAERVDVSFRLATRAISFHPDGRQVIEHGFEEDAAAAVGRAEE
jgi:hypothetical protein